MKFRLGYVASCLSLEDCSPSKTITFKNLNKIDDNKSKIFRLEQISKINLLNTMRILKYNNFLEIKMYRLTSKLIPLATHPDILKLNWEWEKSLKEEFTKLGEFIKSNDMRVSLHPDHFTLINTKSEEILNNSINDLKYHIKILNAMGLTDNKYKLVIHVGGAYSNKEESLNRFISNYRELNSNIKSRIMLENDDKIYSATDVLRISKEISIPVVLDVHHYNCVNSGERLEDILYKAFETWNKQKFPPKIHFSSPKNAKQFRNHAENIDLNDFIAFIKKAKEVNKDFDIMLEAKNKDKALLKLSKELKEIKWIKTINNSEFEF